MKRLVGLIVLLTATMIAPASHALTCIKAVSKNGKVSLSSVTTTKSTCPSGTFKTSDGTFIYGDGSSGASTVLVSSSFTGQRMQFTDLTIGAGVLMQVASGSVIRCTGKFTLNGALLVLPGGIGGGMDQNGSNNAVVTVSAIRAASQGVASGVAFNGESGPNTIKVFGGQIGTTMSFGAAPQLRYPGPAGCGAGGGSISGRGGSAGGAITILAKGAITIGSTGGIVAVGNGGLDGGGGGAGGIIILGSPTSITNGATLYARGGAGGNSNNFAGAGGGGAGGIIHFIAPKVTPGTTSVSGGLAGSTSVTPIALLRSGGGAGGSCFSFGGGGANVEVGGAQNTQTAGGDGTTIISKEDPTSLF